MNNIGILDPEGKKDNPLTNKPYSDEYKKLGKIWSNFPAYKQATSIISDIVNNQVLLIISATGSGKTVLVPKYVLHAFNYTGKIAITLPKQIITKSSAQFAAKTLDVELGNDVGYKYRGSDKSARGKDTKLLYATDGTIVAKLLNDPELREYDAIIIDEAHERKIQIDFLLYLLRNTLKLRPEFKLIIMSATINEKIFRTYFQDFKYKHINIGGGRTFPIKSIFLDRSISHRQATEEGVKIIIELLKEKDPKDSKDSNDIMFFVTSKREADDACKRINKYMELNKKDFTHMKCKDGIFCIEVYSGMNPDKEKLAQEKDLYKKSGDYCRKIVIATPVAESSLTIDGIKYVIDSGYEYRGSYDAKLGGRRLDKALITHAQAKQRMGRTGRTSPGTCYHLYTKNDFENVMSKFPEPDIKTSDITSECLNLLGMESIGTTKKLLEVLTDFIEPPKEIYILNSLKTLKQLKMIKDDKITILGIHANKIGGDSPMDSLFILMGKYYKCSREIIKILSCISAGKKNISPFFRDPSKTMRYNKSQNKKLMFELKGKYNKVLNSLKSNYGDHLTLLNIFIKYQNVRSKYKPDSKEVTDWCKKHFLSRKTLEKSLKNYYALKRNARRGFIEDDKWDDIDVLKDKEIEQMDLQNRILACLMYSYRPNVAFQKYKTQYTTLNAGSVRVELARDSFLNLTKKNPDMLIYYELFISMGNFNLNIASKIPDSVMAIVNKYM